MTSTSTTIMLALVLLARGVGAAQLTASGEMRSGSQTIQITPSGETIEDGSMRRLASQITMATDFAGDVEEVSALSQDGGVSEMAIDAARVLMEVTANGDVKWEKPQLADTVALAEKGSNEATLHVMSNEAEYMVIELGTLKPTDGRWRKVGDYVTVPDGAANVSENNDSIEFDIKCETEGITTVSAEIIAPDARADSLWVKIDGALHTCTEDSCTAWHTGQSSSWTWKSKQITTASGAQRLSIGLREDGIKIRKISVGGACIVDCKVCAQAEYKVIGSGTLTGCWRTVDDEYVTGPDEKTDSIEFDITCENAGITTVSAEIKAPDAGADSLWVKIDPEALHTCTEESCTAWHTGQSSSWTWKTMGITTKLESRRLSIGLREDGIKIRKIRVGGACQLAEGR